MLYRLTNPLTGCQPGENYCIKTKTHCSLLPTVGTKKKTKRGQNFGTELYGCGESSDALSSGLNIQTLSVSNSYDWQSASQLKGELIRGLIDFDKSWMIG